MSAGFEAASEKKRTWTQRLSTLGAWIGVGMLLLSQAIAKPPLVAPPEPSPCNNVSEAGSSRCTTGNELRLLVDGPELRQSLLDDINRAERSIWLNVYEFQDDASAREVASALIAAKARGVDVRLVVDNRHHPKDFSAPASALGAEVERMREAGISVQQPRYSGYKVNHRKIIVVDGTTATVSGANVGGNYLLSRDNGWSYHDAALRLRGPAVQDVARVFIASWRDAGGGELRLPPAPAPLADSSFGAANVQIVSHKGGADRNIEREYVQRLEAAKSRVVLVNGFSISEDIREAIARAEARGVEVVWLWGRASADSAVMAERSIAELRAAGAEVHQLPWPLHMKAAVFDNEHVIIGSANLDGFAMSRNDEAVVQVSSREFSAQVVTRIVAPDLAASTEISHAGGTTTGDARRDFVLRHLLEPIMN